jgi:hypothetical protein
MNREELLKNAKPILFNTEMVQAILDGRKTVTRRKIDRDITNFCDVEVDGTLLDYQNCHGDFINPIDLCRYKVGDILYVRETWSIHECVKCQAGIPALGGECKCEYVYRASYGATDFRWKPSIHMPKEAARIFLKVTDVRVERLQDMTDEDCIAEGIKPVRVPGSTNYREEREFQIACGIATIEKYEELWDSTIKKQDLYKYGWEGNPWVWVIEFERVEVENE